MCEGSVWVSSDGCIRSNGWISSAECNKADGNQQNLVAMLAASYFEQVFSD